MKDLQHLAYLSALRQKTVLNQDEFCALFGVSKMTLWRMNQKLDKKEQPPFFNAGGTKAIMTESAIEWIEQHAAAHPWEAS